MNSKNQSLNRKELSAFDYALSLFLAVKVSTAPFYIRDGDCSFTLSILFSAAMHYVFFLSIVYLSKRFLDEYGPLSDSKSFILKKFGNLMTKPYRILVLWAVLFSCWLPTLIILYPGTLINDSWGQLTQYSGFLRGFPLNDHHPVLTTLIIGFFINTVESLTGNWHLAFFTYVIIQGFFTSFAFAVAVCYSHRVLQIGDKATLLMLLIYALLPVYPTSVQTVSKDAISGWLFVLFTVGVVEIIRTGGKALERKYTVIYLTILGVLCALTKKVNTYVCLFSLIAFLVFFRAWWRKLLFPVLAIGIIMMIVFPILNKLGVVEPGGKQEMLSIPFQQTARLVREHPDDITEEEYQIIDRVIGMKDLAERYNPISADPVKGYSERANTSEYIQYLKCWFSQGLRHPLTYIRAFNAMLAGWFSYSNYMPLLNMDWHSQLNRDIFSEGTATRYRTHEIAQTYQEAYSDLFQYPIASFFLSYVIFAAMIPALCFSILIRKTAEGRSRLWVAMLPLLFSLFLGCFLAPVSIHFEGRRYLYPIIYTEPIILALCLSTRRKR